MFAVFERRLIQHWIDCMQFFQYNSNTYRNCNLWAIFSIPGFGIEEFLIPGSRQGYGIFRYIKLVLETRDFYCTSTVYTVFAIQRTG